MAAFAVSKPSPCGQRLAPASVRCKVYLAFRTTRQRHAARPRALAYARALAPDDEHVIAVHVMDDAEEAKQLQSDWLNRQPGIQLVIIESPYRSLAEPLLAYIDALQETHPKDTITIVLPEYVPSHWWEHLLHNQTALRLKAALLFHPGVVVTNVPYPVSKARAKPA